MTVKAGDKMPDAQLMHMSDAGPAPITTAELFDGKTVALFALPGAFTMDGTGFGMGKRSLRYSMIVRDGTIKASMSKATQAKRSIVVPKIYCPNWAKGASSMAADVGGHGYKLY